MSKLIVADKVEELFLKTMPTPEDLVEGFEFVRAEGIMDTVAFHPDRLKEADEQVREWFRSLKVEFKEDCREVNFIDSCLDRNGYQWTDLHQRMDQLFTLGIGLGIAKFKLPRPLWALCPGGCPIMQIRLSIDSSWCTETYQPEVHTNRSELDEEKGGVIDETV